VPRVLLVDDDIAEISAVKRVLARAGHQAVLATNASDALAALARSAPAAIVVASTCDGGEALRRFAENGAARALPIVVLGETPELPQGAAQVCRPVDPAQLAEQLAAALGTAPAPPAFEAKPAPVPAAPAPRRAARPTPAPAGPQPEPARKAAAEALRARAEELRRGSRATAPAARAAPPPDLVAAADAALAELEAPSPPSEAAGIDLEHDPGLEAILRRAEDAERAHAAERKARARQADRATVEAQQRAEAEQIAVEKTARARAAEERARTEERARAGAEARARAEKEARAGAEERARIEERARAGAEARARAEREARERAEAQRRAAEEEAARLGEEESRRAAEERKRAQEEARRAKEARERARVEREARKDVESELDRLRQQLEDERRSADERAQAEERAAEERHRQEEEARRRAEAEEEELRAAIASARAEMEALRERSGAEEEQLRAAIASARAEMDALRTRTDDEARRREDAEAEIARLAHDAERKAAEAAALPPPLEVPVYRPPFADPAPDPAQETARRRVAALRERPAARAEAPPPSAAPDPGAPRAPLRPPPPELRSGTLAELPAPRLLALAAHAGLGGRLDFDGAATRSLFLEGGRIVGATSSAPAERVEELALRLGLVTREQHRLVSAAAAPLAARRAAMVLLERGFLKPAELGGLVRRRTEEVVFGVFAEAGARFRWASADVPADESTALERTTLQLAVEGVRRRWLAPEVDAVLGGEATLLSPVATAPSADELGLSPGERRVVALADGLRTLDEILLASPLDALSTRQVLAALVLVGALAVRTFQGGRPAAAATAAIDLARVRDKLEQVRRADYFDVLGVGRLCTPHEVREAFERLSAELDPRRFQGVREDGLEARLDEIQRVLADARDVLADDRLRDEYLRGLVD